MKVDAMTKINNNSVGDYSSRFGKVKYNNDTYVLLEKAYYCTVDGFDRYTARAVRLGEQVSTTPKIYNIFWNKTNDYDNDSLNADWSNPISAE